MVSEDKGFNRYGSELLDFCKQTGLRILNGRVRNDETIGKMTFQKLVNAGIFGTMSIL